MREDVKNLSDLSDSREMLETKPNPIMGLFIYLILLIIIVGSIWLYYGKLDQVVKVDGVIRTIETPSTIRNKEPGQIKVADFYEGQEIKKDEIILELDSSEEQLQKKLLKEENDTKETKLADLKLLEKSINKGESYFKKEDKQDNRFQLRYEAYQSSLASLKSDLESENVESNEQKKSQQSEKDQLNEQKENKESKLSQLEKLRDSIDKDENVFEKKEKPYYNRLKNIQSSIKELKLNISETNMVAEENEGPKQREVKKASEESKTNLEQYKNEQLSQINSEIDLQQEEINNLKIQISSHVDYDKIKTKKDNSFEATKKQFKAETLVDINKEIDSVNQELDQLVQNMTTLEHKIEEKKIKAPQNGIVNVDAEVTKGDFIDMGTEIVTIIPETDLEELKVQMTVLNEDIADIKLEDEIDFRVDSLPYQEYGELQGIITEISSDATINPETGESYYLVDAQLNNHTLENYDGKEATVKLGMTTKGHIMTDSKKTLYFLLEKLNLKD